MIVFLDFDGVLHPEYAEGPASADVLFCHLPRFEAVIRDYPSVDIVISSTWREQLSLDAIRARFSADISERIIDVTPILLDLDAKDMLRRRECEILAWLVSVNRESEPWLALDDAAWQFQQHRDKLISCQWYFGLTISVEAALRARLSECV